MLLKSRFWFYSIFFALTFIVFRPVPGKMIDNEFREYVDEYDFLLISECSKLRYQNQHYHIVFSELPGSAIGLCFDYEIKFNILIEKEYWFKHKNKLDRKALMFRELSHCILDLPHVDDENNYMYFETRNITEEELYEQVKSDIRKACQR